MSALPALASEQTAIGEQVLVPGVQPITPAERLAMLAIAPIIQFHLRRPADHGLFDTYARNQLEMF